MRFFIIGDKDTVTGFSLVGVEGVVAHTRVEALNAIKQAMNCRDIGIILITERLAIEIRSTIDELIFRRKCTLILQIPDLNGPLQARRSVEEYVISALGIKV